MRRVTIITGAVIFVGVVAWDAVEFAGGYYAFPLVTGFLPASFFVFALTSCATLVAGIVVLVALLRRQFHSALVLIAIVITSWLLSPWFVARSAFLLGLATRLRQLSSPAEIKQVAQTCLSLLPNGGPVFAPQRVIGFRPFEEEQSKRVWNAISGHSFIHLEGDTCVISVEPPEVTFAWGGVLPGHWGICVGSCHDDPGRTQTLPFAEGMVLFRGD